MTTNFCHPEWSPFWNGEFRTVLHVCSQGHGLLVAVELFHICVPGRWWLSEKQKTTRTTKKNDSSSNDNNNDSKFQQLQQHVPFFLVDAGIEKRCHWLNPKMGSDTPRWRVLVCGFGHVFEEVTSLYPKPLTTLWCHELVSLFTHERHAVFANHIFHHSILLSLRKPRVKRYLTCWCARFDGSGWLCPTCSGILPDLPGFSKKKLSWLSCGWTSPPIKEVLSLGFIGDETLCHTCMMPAWFLCGVFTYDIHNIWYFHIL